MNVHVLTDFLLWCAVLNYGILILWVVIQVLPHAWLSRLWTRMLRVSAEQLDAVSFAGIVLYKTLIILFNIVPYIALRIVG